jgi:hypothetical protein
MIVIKNENIIMVDNPASKNNQDSIQRVSDCCLTPIQQFFSYIMAINTKKKKMKKK